MDPPYPLELPIFFHTNSVFFLFLSPPSPLEFPIPSTVGYGYFMGLHIEYLLDIRVSCVQTDESDILPVLRGGDPFIGD